MRVGLTGGIGSGKSSVAELLAGHGAVIVDADAIAREVVAPGTPGLAAVAREFGSDILTPEGALDRPRLGRLVFADDERRQALEAIVHPLIEARRHELLASVPPGAVVVVDSPLLVEMGTADEFDTVVVVDAPDDVRLERLEQRGLAPTDARARMAAQASREERLAAADHVINNSGSRADLQRQVSALWATLTGA